MKKLITGGNGLVGSSFKSGIKVSSKDFNLLIPEDIDRMIEQYMPDVIVHTAAKVGGIGGNVNYPADYFYENIIMNTNLIHSAYKYNIPKLICFLSTCIFPENVELPLEEEKIHLGAPHPLHLSYAYAKRMAEIQINAYNKQHGTKYYSIIPTNIYGERDNYNLEQGHVVPMLIHKCYLAKINNTDFEVWGSGVAHREFIYSEDLSNIIDILIDKYDGTDSIIISNPKEYTIKDVVNLIVENIGFNGKIIWRTDKPDGQLKKPSSNKRLMDIIGGYEFTTLEDGIKKSVEWFVENYENIRK
jgi:GDP-L-fucose synthase